MALSSSRAFVFAFGTKNHHTTLWLKAEVQAFAELYGVSIDTQPDLNIDPKFKVWYIPEKPNNPSPTLRMARVFVSRAKKDGILCAWVFAAKPHMWRVMRDLEKANREAGSPLRFIKIPRVIRETKRNWFDPTSDQIHTKNFLHWLKRDLVLRLMPFWIYKRIAG